MRIFHGATLSGNVPSSEIRKALNLEQLPLRIESSQLRWFGHVTRTLHERLVRHILLTTPKGTRRQCHSRAKQSDYSTSPDRLNRSRLDVEPVEVFEMLLVVSIWSRPRVFAPAIVPRGKACTKMNQKMRQRRKQPSAKLKMQMLLSK